VCSIGGIIMIGENWRIWSKTCLNAILSTTNLTWTDQGLNMGLHAARMATKLPEPWNGPIHLVYGISSRCKCSLLSYTHLKVQQTFGKHGKYIRTSPRPGVLALIEDGVKLYWIFFPTLKRSNKTMTDNTHSWTFTLLQ